MAKKNLKGIATSAFNSEDAFKSMVGQSKLEEKPNTSKTLKQTTKPLKKTEELDWKLLEEYGVKEPRSKSVHLLVKPSTYKKLQEEAKAKNISVNELINQKLERD